MMLTRSALRRFMLGLGLVGVGCVAGARAHPSSHEAASGPPPEPAAPSAGQLLVTGGQKAAEQGRRLGAENQGAPHQPGYWHWNGVEYVWIEREPVPKRAPYTWR